MNQGACVMSDTPRLYLPLHLSDLRGLGDHLFVSVHKLFVYYTAVAASRRASRGVWCTIVWSHKRIVET